MISDEQQYREESFYNSVMSKMQSEGREVFQYLGHIAPTFQDAFLLVRQADKTSSDSVEENRKKELILMYASDFILGKPENVKDLTQEDCESYISTSQKIQSQTKFNNTYHIGKAVSYMIEAKPELTEDAMPYYERAHIGATTSFVKRALKYRPDLALPTSKTFMASLNYNCNRQTDNVMKYLYTFCQDMKYNKLDQSEVGGYLVKSASRYVEKINNDNNMKYSYIQNQR